MPETNIENNKKSICYIFFEDLINKFFLRKIQMFGDANLNTEIVIKGNSFSELNSKQKKFVINTLIDIPSNNRTFSSLTNEYFQSEKKQIDRDNLILFIRNVNRPKLILSLIYSIIKL